MGSEIRLGPLKLCDLDRLFDWINSRELVLFNSNYRPISENEHLQWFNELSTNNPYTFGIYSSTRELIGTCQLKEINYIHRCAELQIRIGDSNYRGKGFGSKAIQELLKIGFGDINLNRVYLHVFENNLPAIRAYEKTGFLREGLLRQAAHINGNYVNVLVMGMLREEYDSKQRAFNPKAE